MLGRQELKTTDGQTPTLLNDYVMAIDTDWAPDWCVKEVASQLLRDKVKTTWFVTHDSHEIRRLADHSDIFELGIHPNFREDSTQGNTPREVMSHLKKIVPEARSARTHSLLQSSPLLRMMREEFGILYDSSIVLPDTPYIIPHELYLSKNIKILRFPCFWEDDIEMYRPDPCFSLSSSRYHVGGLKIFSFHLIHIALNSSSMETYSSCKSRMDISSCSPSDVHEYANTCQEGAGTLFRELVQHIKDNQNPSGATISDLASRWAMNKW